MESQEAQITRKMADLMLHRRTSSQGHEVTIPSWEQAFTAYPIFDRICAYLQPREIVNFQRTTKRLSGSFESLFKTQWNINRALHRCVADPARFRSEMARHNAIISGSFALQFLDRVIWDDSDLDVYVETEIGSKELGDYLSTFENYRLEEPVEGADTYHEVKGLSQVRFPAIVAGENLLINELKINTYIRKGKKGKGAKIQVIETLFDRSPLSVILTGYYTTAVVNIITVSVTPLLDPGNRTRTSSFTARATYFDYFHRR